MYSYSEIALIHDTRHVRTRFRVDGVKAMSLANRINRGRVCLHCQNDDFTLAKCPVPVATSFYAIFDCFEDIYGHYCIQKRNNCPFLSLFIIIVFKVKRSSFSFFENEQTRPGFLALCVASVCTGIKVLPVSNFAQQLPTTRNNMQQAVQTTQHVTSNNFGSCWPTMQRWRVS